MVERVIWVHEAARSSRVIPTMKCEVLFVAEVKCNCDSMCCEGDCSRRFFETGAMRDMSDGKGRCDLLPLSVVVRMLDPELIGKARTLEFLSEFKAGYPSSVLFCALEAFFTEAGYSIPQGFLEVSKQFEAGAKKYGENNWKKGIPVDVYIDSAVRHYLKWRNGDKDEPHDRAFMWNIICLIWTVENAKKNEDFTEKMRNAMLGTHIGR